MIGQVFYVQTSIHKIISTMPIILLHTNHHHYLANTELYPNLHVFRNIIFHLFLLSGVILIFFNLVYQLTYHQKSHIMWNNFYFPSFVKSQCLLHIN